VLAEDQTAGRGRMGKVWQSAAGNNILISVIIRPKLDSDRIGLLSFFAALSVVIAIEDIARIRCECKWPNDILINGRKCCGILMESTFENNAIDAIIIGIGLNVNQMNFGKDIKDKATSLKRECSHDFSRKEIFQKMMMSMESLYMEVKFGKFERVLEEWKSRTAIFNKNISIIQTDEITTGKALALADDGGLIVETADGKKVFYAGSVSILQ
jgi:BirA family transcriptional regulator, biotin operon repressor / biotin---[acetyl-CoA-carboxylase] ligase